MGWGCPRPLEGEKTLMESTRSYPAMMPDGQQREKARRKGAMDGHMRPDNAVPMFHGAPGAHRSIPGSQKLRGNGLPRRVNALQQMLAGWAMHCPTHPGQQSDGL